MDRDWVIAATGAASGPAGTDSDARDRRQRRVADDDDMAEMKKPKTATAAEESDDSGMSCEEGNTEPSDSPDHHRRHHGSSENVSSSASSTASTGELKVEVEHDEGQDHHMPSSPPRKQRLEGANHGEQPLDFSIRSTLGVAVKPETSHVIQQNPQHPANGGGGGGSALAAILLSQKFLSNANKSAFNTVGDHQPMAANNHHQAHLPTPHQQTPPGGMNAAFPSMNAALMNPMFNPFLAGLMPQFNAAGGPPLYPPTGAAFPPVSLMGGFGPSLHEQMLMSQNNFKLATTAAGEVKGGGAGKPPTRPFKAYNPGDPLSALQITVSPQTPTQSLVLPGGQGAGGGVGAQGNGAQSLATDALMRQYREFMANAQSALERRNGGNGGTAAGVGPGDGRPITTTPSPPQVTSTSHPHTATHIDCQPSSNVSVNNVSSQSASSSGASSNHSASVSPQHQHHLPLATSASMPASVIRTSLHFGNHGALPAAPPATTAPPPPPPASSTPGSVGPGTPTRKKGKPAHELVKDDAYWERRRKNNDAAKRSRDTRRNKEDEIAMRAAILEQDNLRLRIEVAQLKSETDKLRQLLVHP